MRSIGRNIKRKEGFMNDRKRKVRIRPVKKDEPDLRRLARALIDLAISQNQQGHEAVESDAESGETEEEAA